MKSAWPVCFVKTNMTKNTKAPYTGSADHVRDVHSLSGYVDTAGRADASKVRTDSRTISQICDDLITNHPEAIWLALSTYLVSEGYTIEICRADVFKATRADEDGQESTVLICKRAVNGWTFEYDWPYEICEEDPTPSDEGYVTDSGYADSASEAIGGVFAYLLGYAS